MFSGLQDDQLKGALEAMLFVTDEPVEIRVLAKMLETTALAVQAALHDLAREFEEEERGIQLREVAGGWRLFTHPVYHELLEKYVVSWDTRKLSQAAIETLAIIAYSQPATRQTVSQIRGVNSDSSVNSLLEKGLIKEAGVDEGAGNAILYATTRSFLERFGLRSVADLPELETYAPDEETREFIRERLSATRRSGFVALREESQEDGGTVVDFDFELEIDEDAMGTEFSDAPVLPASMAQAMLAEAMAGSLGLVEKVDLDALDLDAGETSDPATGPATGDA